MSKIESNKANGKVHRDYSEINQCYLLVNSSHPTSIQMMFVQEFERRN